MDYWTGLARGGVGFWVTASHWLTANDEHETDSLTSTLHSQTDTINNWRCQRDALLPANKTSAKRVLLDQP